MNPLQERANLLRAEFKKQEADKHGYHQQWLKTDREQLINMFSVDFPDLYELLLQSQILVDGDITTHSQKVILSSADKQLSIYFEGNKNELNTWRFRGKDYMASTKESEQRLIIELADAFAQAQSKRASIH